MLFVRCVVIPAKFVRPLDPQPPLRFLDGRNGLVDEELLELRGKATDVGKKSAQAFGTGWRCGGGGGIYCDRAQQQQAANDSAHHDSIPTGGGARTSRLPFDCSGPTTPVRSI